MKIWPRHPVVYLLSGESYDRSGDEMRDAGLYVDLKPWQCHLLQMRAL
jgi:hypothetical protein